MNNDVLLEAIKDIINIRDISIRDTSIDYYDKSEMKKKETVITVNTKEMNLDDVLKIMESKE